MKFSVQEFNPADPAHQESAAMAASWADQSGQMCSMNAETMAENTHDLHAIAENGRPLGHIAVTSLMEGQAIIGGFVVSPAHRGQGIGSMLVESIVDKLAEHPELAACQAYANDDSRDIFRRAGGRFAGFRDPNEGHGRYIIDMMPAVQAKPQPVAA